MLKKGKAKICKRCDQNEECLHVNDKDPPNFCIYEDKRLKRMRRVRRIKNDKIKTYGK
nr:MAG: hypothetical protein [Microvirus Sku114]